MSKTTPITSDGLLTIKQAAAFLGISVSTFYANVLVPGLVPTVPVGGRRQIPRKALVEFAESRLQAS